MKFAVQYEKKSRKSKRSKGKNIRKANVSLFAIVLFITLFMMPIFYAYADEENKNIQDENEQSLDDGIRFLEFENHTLFPSRIPGFIAIKKQHDLLYHDVELQMPSNAYLLDVYVPNAYERDLNRESYENITRMVYLYTMPLLLKAGDRLHKLQLSIITQAMESVYTTYTTLARPTLAKKFEWETKVYNLFKTAKSVYFPYPKSEKNPKLTVLQTFSMGDDRYAGSFLSTHIFIRNRQIYFLSVSAFLTGNNYHEEFMWTRDTLDKFIKLLPEVRKKIIE